MEYDGNVIEFEKAATEAGFSGVDQSIKFINKKNKERNEKHVSVIT